MILIFFHHGRVCLGSTLEEMEYCPAWRRFVGDVAPVLACIFEKICCDVRVTIIPVICSVVDVVASWGGLERVKRQIRDTYVLYVPLCVGK